MKPQQLLCDDAEFMLLCDQKSQLDSNYQKRYLTKLVVVNLVERLVEHLGRLNQGHLPQK
jgi:hypothetical protein